ncbi:MAG: arginine--tRNA ligase [Patescibacteria group bacterium]|nr:arginine--tRNA ligase [Patescibacteria group bacterium]
MNYSWDAILSHVARRVGEAAEIEVKADELVLPPKSEMGDLAFGCFKIAKAKATNPAEAAKELAAKMSKVNDHSIEKVEAAGPYVNIVLKTSDLALRVIQDVERMAKKYGFTEEGRDRQLMLEYAQPNTHKEMHVGHLRNLVLGSSLARLLLLDGWKVISASYHGDVGAHVSKCLWLLVRQHSDKIVQPKPKLKKGQTPPADMPADAWADHVIEGFSVEMADQVLHSIEKDKRTGNYLGQIYSESTKLLEENEEWKKQVSLVQQKLEAKDVAWNKLWQETRRWSVIEMQTIFQELGVLIDRPYFESEVVDQGQKQVDVLLKAGIAKESQGAIIVDLEAEKLGVFVIRRTDGTALYSTKDLALAQLKFEEYPKLERSLHLIDNRQSLYFKQLSRALGMMGMKKTLEFVGYEFLTLKSGAMSSREGNIVTYQSFRDELLAYARKETAARHEDWPDGKIEHVAWCIAMGGLKYGMLKQDSDKVIVFDLEKSLAFDGDTGPYIQYAVTRLNSILKKAGWEPGKNGATEDTGRLKEPQEKILALKMAAFPAVCRRAAIDLKPTAIARWCFDTAQAVNDFYRDVPVLTAEAEIKEARLRLAASVASVMILGLDLLGIPVPEEM